jgi:hypothetical protein
VNAPGPARARDDGSAAAPAHDAGEGELGRLQADFPQFLIWREAIAGRRRYVARRLAPGTRPHTLVSPDPGELRAALAQRPRYSEGGGGA